MTPSQSSPSETGTVLQVGATGKLGGRIADRLLDRGVDLRILVREGSDPEHLVEAGAEPVQGDLRDPASLEAAVKGVDRVLTTANAPGGRSGETVEDVDLEGNAALVEAADEADVTQLVFTSAWLAEPDDPDPFFAAKGRTEERLRAADLAETILAPNVFYETSIPPIVLEPALDRGEVTLVGEGRRRHTWVSINDVADLAASVLARPDAYGERLRFGGPEAVTWRGIVARVEETLDREIDVAFVEPGEPVAGLSDFEAGVLAGSETFDSDVDTSDVAEAFGVERTTLGDWLRDWAREHAP